VRIKEDKSSQGGVASYVDAGEPKSDAETREKARSLAAAGFTLLEVMIALAIVGTVLVALLGLGNRTIAVSERIQRLTQATMLAQAKMTEVELAASAAAQMTPQDEEGVFEEPFTEYRWQSRFTPTPLDRVQQVVVTVIWGDEAHNEAVDLTSFILRP